MSFCLAKTASLCLCVLYSNNLNVFALPLQMKVWVGFPQSSRDQQLPRCRLVLGWDQPHKGSCGSLQDTFFLPERRCCSEHDPSCLPEAHAATPMPGAGLLKSFAWVCRANSCSRVSLLYSFLLACNHLFRYFFFFFGYSNVVYLLLEEVTELTIEKAYFPREYDMQKQYIMFGVLLGGATAYHNV